MRLSQLVSVALALVCGACARTRLVAPGPSPAAAAAPATESADGTGPHVVLAGSAADASAVSATEAINYILRRTMLIPVAGMTVSQLEDTFDEGRSSGRVHRALDILAPRGTPVVAADSGRVLRMSVNSLGGNTIYATDPQGRIVYYYAHLDAYRSGLVQGATIARGDTLGFVGTTGNAPKDTPHLHFQVMRMPPDGKYWDGEAINPYPLFLLVHDAARR
jgi:murein DD-endopeptidase MepM/ murein hydrolase activator NlpD